MLLPLSIFKKVTLGMLVLGVLLLTPPISVQATTTSSITERAALLAQIQILTKEVERLKVLLAAKVAVQKPLQIYESRFSDVSFETVYRVTPEGLLRLDTPEAGVRPVDAQIFSLLTDVIGLPQIQRHIDDFRVFNNENTELSAFVETKSGGDAWLLGVNRSGFSLSDLETKASFIDLFLHEYAHLLLFEEADLTSDFEEAFWTSADHQHAKRVEKAVNKFPILEAYFEDNNERFVSDYATMNVDEDMAESFVLFVINSRPTGTERSDEKVRFFYGSETMVEERIRLRQNLRELGVQMSFR